MSKITEGTVTEKVKRIIATVLEIDPPEKITLESHLSQDLGADSLDTVAVITAAEEEFDINDLDEKLQKFMEEKNSSSSINNFNRNLINLTVQDIVDYIEKHP